MRPPPAYPTHLEPRYLRALLQEWHRINQFQLRSALKPPAFELVDSSGKLGAWLAGSRTIQMSRALVHGKPWGVVVEVLRHEVAHQYTSEVLCVSDETAHGPAFRQVCERFGIDAAATGLPAPNADEARVHRRVEKLLALAGSTNRHEAELAMAEARRQMLLHNLQAPPTHYSWRHLGTPSGRTPAWRRQLSALLREHFFVETLWVRVYHVATDRWLTTLEVCGTPGNVEMAEWVHGWLVAQAERLWASDRQVLGLAGPAEHARYLSGLVRGFNERLKEGARQSAAAGLVWVGDPAAREFVGKRWGRLRSITYMSSRGDQASNAGFAQGKALVMNKPVGGRTGGGGKSITMKPG